MRAQWLKQLGKKGSWDLFTEEYPSLYQEDLEITCYALQARFARSQDSEALHEARQLWFTGRRPANCTPFDALVTGGCSPTRMWVRIRSALEAWQVTLAKRVNRYLPGEQALDERLLDAVYDNPQRYLERRSPELKTRAGQELALFALQRAARSSTYQAYFLFGKVRENLSGAEQRCFLGSIAYRGARRLQPEALDWYREAAALATPFTDEQLAWRARSALRANNWGEVISAVDAMSPREQRFPGWRYWKGRALKQLGRPAEANAIFAPLSTELHFYGQLAGEELGVVVAPPSDVHKPGQGETQAVQQLAGIQRALALYRLDLRTEGALEWIWAIRGFDDRQLLAAAEVARRNELWDRVINTADKTVQLHDSASFPRSLTGSAAGAYLPARSG